MSESLSIDEGWEESLDSEQVTHVKGEAVTATAASGEWLVNVSEQVVVPMTTTDVVEALRTQRITGRSLVWRTGMQDWTPLSEVPPLRLAAGPLATQPARPPAPVPAPRAAQPERLKGSTSERVLHPPPKEPARAARDERRRRNTLPFGFPVVRDPASVRQPTGLHGPAPAAVAAPEPSSRPRVAEVEALAIYERATPSLTFSDSVRAEWQGTTGLVHQPSASPAPLPSSAPVVAPSVVSSRPEPKLEPKPRLSLEPQSDPKPRLTLEPQSDPMQSARIESPYQLSGSQPPNSLAPTTSEPENELPVRGAGLWGDLSVVLASDLRAVQASSKRLTLIASIGSAALASLLTLWFAHSSTRHAPGAAPAAQAVEAPAKAEVAAVPSVVVLPAATLVPPVTSASAAHAQPATTAVLSSPPVAIHAAPKPAVAAAPRVAARPKPAPVRAAEADSDTPSVAADPNPYADSPEHSQPKTPTAAFKETSAAPTAKPDTDAVAPSVASGLEDSAKSVHPAPTATPGF